MKLRSFFAGICTFGLGLPAQQAQDAPLETDNTPPLAAQPFSEAQFDDDTYYQTQGFTADILGHTIFDYHTDMIGGDVNHAFYGNILDLIATLNMPAYMKDGAIKLEYATPDDQLFIDIVNEIAQKARALKAENPNLSSIEITLKLFESEQQISFASTFSKNEADIRQFTAHMFFLITTAALNSVETLGGDYSKLLRTPEEQKISDLINIIISYTDNLPDYGKPHFSPEERKAETEHHITLMRDLEAKGLINPKDFGTLMEFDNLAQAFRKNIISRLENDPQLVHRNMTPDRLAGQNLFVWGHNHTIHEKDMDETLRQMGRNPITISFVFDKADLRGLGKVKTVGDRDYAFSDVIMCLDEDNLMSIFFKGSKLNDLKSRGADHLLAPLTITTAKPEMQIVQRVDALITRVLEEYERTHPNPTP